MTRFAHVLVLGIASACAATESSRSQDSASVATLVRERLAAALAGDTAAWHRQVSDSCVFTGAELRVSLTKDVIGSIAANRALGLKAQRIDKLVVHFAGGVAQATYVQLVQDAGQQERQGKRFRKTDTYARVDGSWKLIGSAEVPVPFRPLTAMVSERAAATAGRYSLGVADTLTLASVTADRLTLTGTDGVVDTLLVENDSTLYADGDAGSWIVRGSGVALLYRSTGAADIVLTRVRP
jgi:hypothetical protein